MIVGGFIQKFAATIAAGALFLTSAADACTGVRLIAADGTVVHARTLEFAVDLQSDVLVSPRGFERVGMTPDGQDGLKWKAKYASVGANGVGLPILIDGVNGRSYENEFRREGHRHFLDARRGDVPAPHSLSGPAAARGLVGEGDLPPAAHLDVIAGPGRSCPGMEAPERRFRIAASRVEPHLNLPSLA
jgi:hypothetical protein